MTMPTIGSPLGSVTLLLQCSWLVVGRRAREGEGIVDDAVGEVAGRRDGARAHLAQLGAEGGDMAEVAAGALPLAVPVQLHVRPVGHEVVDPLVEARAGPVIPRRGTTEHVG